MTGGRLTNASTSEERNEKPGETIADERDPRTSKGYAVGSVGIDTSRGEEVHCEELLVHCL